MSEKESFNLKAYLTENSQVKLYFVQKDDELSEDMKVALETAKEVFTSLETIDVITQEKCLNIRKAELKRSDHILVFDEFAGDAFDYCAVCANIRLFSSNAFYVLIAKEQTLPIELTRVHNLSFYGLVVCTTTMKNAQKGEIRKLVNFMGGSYTDTLLTSTTHLVTDQVRSCKYEEAAESNIQIMHPDWITKLWASSQKKQKKGFPSSAADAQFDVYKLPIFFNLSVSTSGMKTGDRNIIQAHVEANGGKFSPAFGKSIDILVVQPEDANRDKINLALRNNKAIVSQKWIHDSLEKGYSLNFDNYKVNLCRSSTPVKDTTMSAARFNPDSSRMSAISAIGGTTSHIDNTLDATVNQSVATTMLKSPKAEPAYRKVMAMLTLRAAKKSPNIFDGLTFYLQGFEKQDLVPLAKILGTCGAATSDEINESVTHVLLGDEKAFKGFESSNVDPVVLKLEWLHECLEKRKVADGAGFEIETKRATAEPPSPASLKAIKSLSSTFKKPFARKLRLTSEDAHTDQEEEMAIVGKYLEAPAPNDQDAKIFNGKTFHVHALSAEEKVEVTETCRLHGATLVDEGYRREVDYIITQAEILNDFKPPVKFRNVVSLLWLDDCCTEGKCLEVEYFHKPLVRLSRDQQPLKKENIVVSAYRGNEKKFIKQLITNLGGEFQDRLTRAENPILICPIPEGEKFRRVLMWNTSALSVQWLVECYKLRQRLDETEYLIGNAVPSKRNIRGRCSFVPSSQEFTFEEETRKNGLDEVEPTTDVAESQFDSPDTPAGTSLSRMMAQLPTPCRAVTRSVLMEMQARNVVPQIVDSPDVASKLKLPDCVKTPDPIWALRPNASPASHYFHKRKIEGLDLNYEPRQNEKRMRMMPSPEVDLAASRHDFFKSRLPEYDSPDPRVAKQQPQQPTEPKQTAVDNASNFDSPVPRGAVQPAANRQDFDKRELPECDSPDPNPKAATPHQQQQPTESQQDADDDASNFLNINTENDDPEVSAGCVHTENDESIASNESDPSNVINQSNVTNQSNDFNQSMTVSEQSD